MEPEDLGYAIKAVQQENNFAALHALDCVYAEIGKMKEAHDILIQAMDRLNVDEPELILGTDLDVLPSKTENSMSPRPTTSALRGQKEK
jgi:hypothetical protein